MFLKLETFANELFDTDGNLNPYSHKLWENISEELNSKISKNSLYISVYQDRHSWQTLLRDIVSKPLIKMDCILTDDDHDDIMKGDDESETEDESDGLKNDEKMFKFDIPYRDYVKMNPVNVKYGKKNSKKLYTVLQQGIWTNVINDWFTKHYKTPCNIIYKRCRVQNYNKVESKHYLTFSGKCKDCQAVLFGWADEKPKEAMPLVVHIILQGMKTNEHHISKRPLNGIRRREVDRELLNECASNWRRKAVKSFDFEDNIPANIYD